MVSISESKKNTILTAGKKKRNTQRLVFIITILLAAAAWLIGFFSKDIEVVPFVSEVIPGTVSVDIRGNLFVSQDADGNVLGYAAVGGAQGYGGPIDLLVGVSPEGEIIGIKILVQRETPGFFRLIKDQNLLDQFIGKNFTAPLQLGGEGIDAVSGATISSEGIASSVRQAVQEIARDGLNSPLPRVKRSIKFGVPEITLIGLYAAGYFGHKTRNSKLKRNLRWGTLLTGMIVLGFIYTAPLTISQVIALLSGFWPDWHNNLYWYLLIGGILFVTTVDSKNPYCSWFCPFGAFQECLAKISGAKLYKPRKWREVLTWTQRGLAFIAILLGFLLRRPGVAGYEPFATVFDLRGTTIQWIFLILVVIASLLAYRPFCNYLCPLDPVYDFIAESRRWLREGWSKWAKRK